MILLYFQAVRLSPWPIFGINDASLYVFQKALKPGLAYMGFPIAQVIGLQGSLQILYQTAPPAVVVAFIMGRTLMRLIIQIGVVANNALKPEISRLAGIGLLKESEKFSIKASRYILLGSLIVYISMVYLGPQILKIWSNEKVTGSHFDLLLIGIHAIINVAWFIPAALLIATNKHSQLSIIYGVSSVGVIIIWIAISHKIPPILGASIVLAIPEAVALIYMQIYQRRKIFARNS
jgi:O-antigen/teichoic acid export membrane protein